MNKPVFLWWAHKMLWDMLAKHNDGYPYKTTAVVDTIKDTYILFPIKGCFACDSVANYFARKYNIHRLDVTPDIKDNCQYCPLNWGTYSGTCYRKDSFYDMWNDYRVMQKYQKAAECAAKIRDLPLKENAHELYDIKESPNE